MEPIDFNGNYSFPICFCTLNHSVANPFALNVEIMRQIFQLIRHLVKHSGRRRSLNWSICGTILSSPIALKRSIKNFNLKNSTSLATPSSGLRHFFHFGFCLFWLHAHARIHSHPYAIAPPLSSRSSARNVTLLGFSKPNYYNSCTYYLVTFPRFLLYVFAIHSALVRIVRFR